MTQNEELAFGGDTEATAPQRYGNASIIKTPTKENALVCRLLPDSLRGNAQYFEVDLIKHMVGPDPQKDTRYHLSRRMLNDKSPETDRYWDVVKEMKALKDKGQENSEEFRKLDFQKKLFNTNKRYWLLVLPLGESKPKALQVTWKAIKELFGAPARGKDPAHVGLVETMKAKGRSPYNLKSDKGWVKIWREGTGLETTWKVEEAKIEKKIDGEDVTVPLSQAVPEDLFKLKKSDIPDLGKLDMTEEKVWTLEECERFVASLGTAIPDRCKKRQSTYSDGDSKPQQVAKAPDNNSAAFIGGATEEDDFDLDGVI